MLYCGIPLGVIGVVLLLFGPERWWPQIAIVAIAVAALLICGREWRKGL
jgi:membrane protein implicated in regulation of membrane protease activity